jgi:chromosomal replication initiator protein
MSNPDQERWLRVKERLRAEVGEEIYQSWFASMELDRVEGSTVLLTVPTRFLKSWTQTHYSEKLLACWQAEAPDVLKVEVSVRSAVIRAVPPKPKAPETVETARDPHWAHGHRRIARGLRAGLQRP